MKFGSLLLGLIVLGSGAAHAAPIRVAVEDNGTGSGIALAAQLNDDTYFDFTATVVTAGQIDSAAELANYDVVVLGDSGSEDADWTAAMGSALKTWVEAGHGAVMTGWGNLFTNDDSPFGADFETIFPTQNIPSTNEFAQIDSTIHFSGVHPVTAGLTDFAPELPSPSSTCCIEINTFAPEPNDTVLATINGQPGDIVVAVKNAIGSGRSVYLGPVYNANASNYPDAVAALRSGQADRLLEQAVHWAAVGGATLQPRGVPAVSPLGEAILAILMAVAGAVALRRS